MKIGVIKFLFYAGSRNVLAWKRNTDQYTPGPAHSCRLQQLQLDQDYLIPVKFYMNHRLLSYNKIVLHVHT